MNLGEHADREVSLSTAASLADLAWLLARVRLREGNPALRDIESRGRKLGLTLPRATVADALSGKRLPRLNLLLNLLRALRVPEDENAQWCAAWERAAEKHMPTRRARFKDTAAEPSTISSPATPVRPNADRRPDLGRLWTFDGRWPIVLACGDTPQSMADVASYRDPENPDYVAFYSYSDPDSLVELHGHVRASNPSCEVHINTADGMQPGDYSGHLAILGGTDFNKTARDFISRLKMPVQMNRRDGGAKSGTFELVDGSRRLFSPVLSEQAPSRNPVLIEDVALFYRGINPFNHECSVTVCAGIYARGTLAAVKASTDPSVRGRNERYIKYRFSNSRIFGILARAHVVNGVIMPPDWTIPDNVLYEWQQ